MYIWMQFFVGVWIWYCFDWLGMIVIVGKGIVCYFFYFFVMGCIDGYFVELFMLVDYLQCSGSGWGCIVGCVVVGVLIGLNLKIGI